MGWVDKLWKEKEEYNAAAANNVEEGLNGLLGIQRNTGINPVTEYGAAGTGLVNDAPAINNALSEAGNERAVVLPPGLYRCDESVKVPATGVLIGLNPRTTRLKAKGEINLITVAGDNRISGLQLESETIQAAKGSAIDFSKGKPDNVWLTDLTLGSNFFNGINCVGASGEFGGVHMHRIHFVAEGAGVKKYGNAGIVIGSSTVRTVAVFIQDVHMQVATTADMVRGIEINNSDSVHIGQVLLQNPKIGLGVGNADASAKRTTNLFLADVQADGCTEGFRTESLLEESNFWGCHAEACGTGMVIGESTSGLVVSGSSFYHCQSHGINILGSVSPTYGNSIVGNHIHSNGENTEATAAGILIAEKAGGLVISGNSIGNPALIGGGLQKIGITVGKKAENILISNNRIFKNVTAQIKKEGEEVGVKAEVNLET